MATRDRLLMRVTATVAVAVTLAAAPVAAAQEARDPQPKVEAEGFWHEPPALGRGLDFAINAAGGTRGELKNGFYPEFGAMVTGAGWISGGPGYRHWLRRDSVLLEASAAYSWRGYRAARARVELPRLARSRLGVGLQYRWQDLTQIDYFGEGPDSRESSRTEYRLRSQNVVGYGTVRPSPWLSFRASAGWLGAPGLESPGGHFMRALPSTLDLYADSPTVARGAQPAFLHGELAAEADTRDSRQHPVRGGLYRGSWATYRDRTGGTFTFQRYEAEGVHFVPLSADRVVLAVHGWTVMTGAGDGRTVPFYLQPSLGGHNTLRGFANYRFHDRHLALVNVEARVAVFTHLDAAVFADAGNVAGRVRDLNLDRTSLGGGLRLHTSESTFARLDLAHGSEGWSLVFRLHDPLRLARTAVRTAAVPFVP